jgi:hypothetical protein
MTLYISRLKFRPLTWRNTHPYVLVDRFEDVTPPETLHAAPHVRWAALPVLVGCLFSFFFLAVACLCGLDGWGWGWGDGWSEKGRLLWLGGFDPSSQVHRPTQPPTTQPQPTPPPPNLQSERELVLYGYVRGSHLKPGMKVHLIGAGDFDMASVRACVRSLCTHVM